MGKSADGDILNIEEKKRRRGKSLTPAVFLAVLLFFVSIAYGRNMVWMNELMLWTDAAANSPYKARGRMAPLEIIMSGPGLFDEAERIFLIGLRLHPDVATWHYNVGFTYYMQRRNEDAIKAYLDAIERRPIILMRH